MRPDLSPRARRGLRRAGIAALALLALAVVGWLAGGLLLRSLLDRERLARWSEARLEAALDRDVGVESVALSVFPGPAVELRGLRVDNPPGFEGPPFARAERARLQVALWPLVRRRVVVEEAVLSGAALSLAVREDGRSNYDGLSAGGRPDPTEGSPPFRTRIEEVRLEESSIAYVREAQGLRVEAAGISGRARLGGEEGGRSLSLEARAPAVRAGGLPGGRILAPVPARLALEARLAGGGLTVESGRLELGEVVVGVSGRVDSLASPVRRLDLRLAADGLRLADVAALARRVDDGRGADGAGGGASAGGDERRVEGRLSADLDMRGPWGPGARPTVSGRIGLREGRITAGAGPLTRELTAEARVRDDSVVLERLRGRLLGGELDAGGALSLDSTRSWRLRVRARPRLERWPGTPERVEVGGVVDADLALRGRGLGPGGLRTAGTLRAEGVSVAPGSWSARLEIPAGTVRLVGDSAVTDTLPVVAAGDTLHLHVAAAGVPGRLLRQGPVPTFRGSLRGDRLDLDALLGAPPGDEIGRVRLALASLGGRRIEGRTAASLAAGRAGLPDSLPADGTLRVELGELVRRPWRLADLSLRLELAPGRAAVTGASFGFLGGTGRADGELTLGETPAAFRLRVEAEGVSSGELLAASTPAGRLVDGRADLELAVSGRLDSLLLPLAGGLEGEGRLLFEEGRLRSNPVTSTLAAALRAPALESPGFRRWTQPFTLRADTLLLAPSAPEGLELPLRLGGRLGLGGGLGLAVTAEVPPATVRALAGRAGGLPATLLDRVAGSGPLPVALRVVGTVDSPRAEVDAAALREALEASARREAGQAARQGAGALLRRLLGDGGDVGPDSAGARGDTVRADAPDSVAPDSSRTAADTTRAASADTAGPAPPDTAGSPPPDTTRAAPGG